MKSLLVFCLLSFAVLKAMSVEMDPNGKSYIQNIECIEGTDTCMISPLEAPEDMQLKLSAETDNYLYNLLFLNDLGPELSEEPSEILLSAFTDNKFQSMLNNGIELSRELKDINKEPSVLPTGLNTDKNESGSKR